MSNAKQIVQQCGKLIEDSVLKDRLLPLWRLIEWQAHQDDTIPAAALDSAGNATIHLAASVSDPKAVLVEFGKFILQRSGERGTAIWKNKLDAPTAEQVALAKQKLEDPQLRTTCKTYRDVLDSYPAKGGSVDRLVFINLTNALLANNISYPDSVGVDIMTWGPTTAYAKREKYHCLIPLVSAYAPADVYNDFGAALAAMVMDNLGNVRDSSVAFALRGIIQRIVVMVSPN